MTACPLQPHTPAIKLRSANECAEDMTHDEQSSGLMGEDEAETDQSLNNRAAQAMHQVKAKLANRPIVLVGMMGAGKTTVGRRLAKRMDRTFVDADHEIEAAAAMTIPEIFEKHGEDSFRDGERKVIHRLLDDQDIILATGGGAFMDPETRTAIAAKGVSVWLKAEFSVLMARVRRKSNRPLLQQKDPEAVMRQLIEVRYPVYAEADLTVVSKNTPHSVVVSEILLALEAHVLSQVPNS